MHALEQAIRKDGAVAVAKGIKTPQQRHAWMEFRLSLRRLVEQADLVLDKVAEQRPERWAGWQSSFKAKMGAPRSGELEP
jgi:hypothetical protein